ncbi:MAG: hypothetical protein KC535_05905 [Nanoarchaeota archaeon]|nr:hypothetical protein [Nanoarchaeota archaeon]
MLEDSAYNEKEGETSLRDLETRINANNLTIKKHCEELEYLGHIELTQHKKNEANGRPYTTAKLQ